MSDAVQNTGIKTLFIDFNDTLSPSNFVQCFDELKEQTGWDGQALATAYIDAGLLGRLMKGEVTEQVFWEQVADLTKVPVHFLLDAASRMRETKQVDQQVMKLVQTIKQRGETRLVLMTDNVQEMFDYWLEKFQLTSLFDYIVNSAWHGMTKREAQFYTLALDLTGAEAPNTLLVDDDPRYLSVAATAGLQTVQFVNAEQLAIDLGRLRLM